ncbi:hypothetical protein [Litorihabitans aurantiacus]|uniref:Uncharacterized protein n=1 Tax=Litorihabitans aurantiacus TaxID=1930061 RepID=A0AA37XHM1_9MICO|nr:hypothetical protein [Litorihabitans aurantiacus]GMA33527.1 hypothetical protein GCM10025875_35190 [Litorihabitans aurantiacus]GMA33620.1 hypothetical protein GCM10025875_36120 [Litorihabitans aurantiacus]
MSATIPDLTFPSACVDDYTTPFSTYSDTYVVSTTLLDEDCDGMTDRSRLADVLSALTGINVLLASTLVDHAMTVLRDRGVAVRTGTYSRWRTGAQGRREGIGPVLLIDTASAESIIRMTYAGITALEQEAPQ